MEHTLASIEWPNKARNAILDVEGKYNLKDVKVCHQCSQVHLSVCEADPSKRPYFPVEAKEQRIFIRRQKWIWLLTACQNDLEIAKINIKLNVLFTKTKEKPIHDLTDSELFISEVSDFPSLQFYFCDAIARTFEESSSMLKVSGNLKSEIAELSYLHRLQIYS